MEPARSKCRAELEASLLKSFLVQCFRAALALGTTAAVVGCSDGEVTGTQLLVTVEASPGVAAKITFLRALLFPLGALDESTPTQVLPLPLDGHRGTVGDGTEVRSLGSFGIAKGRDDRFKLVIYGYDSSDPGAPPLIEQKAIVSFQEQQKLSIRMSLLDACYQRAATCSGLDKTCSAASGGICGPVPDLGTSTEGMNTPILDAAVSVGPMNMPMVPTEGLVGPTEAGVMGTLTDEGGTRDDGGLSGADPIGSGLLAPPGKARTLAAGGGFTCALRAGAVWCWGSDDGSALGNGDAGMSLVPTPVIGITDAVGLAVGHGHGCVRNREGHVSCWGWNFSGQVGDGTTVWRDQAVKLSFSAFTSTIVARGSRTCALTELKLVAGEGNGLRSATYCWGHNFDGQLATGDTQRLLVPTESRPFSSVNEVALGDAHTCILFEGSVECVGNNSLGQLGDGSTTDSHQPVKVGGLTDVVELAAGQTHTCARHATGRVSCWGGNLNGELGDGTMINRSTPVAVPGLSDVVEISAGGWGYLNGGSHTCARLLNGQVSCWGLNDYGQLGDGTTFTRLTPTMVRSLTQAVEVTTGETHSCAKTASGQIFCWGDNYYGELGNNSQVDSPVPVRVAGF